VSVLVSVADHNSAHSTTSHDKVRDAQLVEII
jgi:hypothetical protein